MMRQSIRNVCLSVTILLAACAQAPALPPVQPYTMVQLDNLRYRAVLVAGDGSLPVFDNAVEGMVSYLRTHGVPDSSMVRLSAIPATFARSGIRSATLDHVLDAIGQMKPGPGEGCLVFATSHGAYRRGLALTATGTGFLDPGELDRALAQGCGNAPTVVVMSGCFTGTFARPPMARANRVILTAASPTRTSFGCGAGRDFTVYDKCFLDGLGTGGTWAQEYDRVSRCVSATETEDHVLPSQPQKWLGSAVPDFPLPKQSPR